MNGGPVELVKGQDFYFVNDPNCIGDNTRVIPKQRDSSLINL